MLKRNWLGNAAAMGVALLAGFWPNPALAQLPAQPVIQADEAGLTFTWTPAAYTLTGVEVDGVEYSRLQIADTTLSAQPGYPELPLYSGLVGLPPQGEARLQVVEVEQETIQLPHPPLPAPSPEAIPALPTEIDPVTWDGPITVRRPDPAVYAANTLYPAQVANLGPPQQFRHQRLAALTIYPLQVNPITGQMAVLRRIRLKISFAQPGPALSQQNLADPLAAALGAILLNPSAAGWRSNSTAALSQTDIGPAAAGWTYKVQVSQPGLYALTYADLQAAGLPVTALDPRTLTLSHGYPRQEVAILVEGEADGFQPGNRLLFYAEPQFSRYVDYDVYFLSYGGANGRRMAGRSGQPAGLPGGTAWRTITLETNRYYDPLYPGRNGDHWYWDKLFQPSVTSRTYTLTIEKPFTDGPNATLTLWLQGYTDPVQNPDHKVRVTVNGRVAGEKIWNGKQAITATFSVPSSGLSNGSNQVNLSLPGSGASVEGTWLDALAITYPTNQAATGQLRFQGEAGPKSYTLTGWSGSLSVYDVTDPLAPQRVTGFNLAGSTLTLGDISARPATYLIVPGSQIKSVQAVTPARTFNNPAGGADYIIIAPSSLVKAVAPLAAHRAAQGLRVVTVEAEALYDTFGPGRLEPAALKAFLQHAYATWPGEAPLYVLLVGDGSYDFKNYSGFNPPTLLPPYLAMVDPWWGETAADNQLVTLAGNDNLPDMLIGRLPANTPAEVTTIVDKIITYETSPPPGLWNLYQLFVVDNPDGAGDFHAEADQGFNQVSSPFWGRRLYYNPTSTGQPYVYTNANTLRANLKAYWNNGASLITFHGHSSWHQWALESLFHLNDLAALSNQYRLPVVLEMTCFTGFFHHPEYPTLDESLVRQPGRGAVAVWGSTGLGVATGHKTLQAGFLQAIASQSRPQLGAAVLAAKTKLAATGFNLDLLNTMTLLGDPALHLHLTVPPRIEKLVLPVIFKNRAGGKIAPAVVGEIDDPTFHQ